MFTLFIAAWLGQAAMTPAQAADATTVTLSAPKALVEVDAAKLKGEPVRLAWGSEQEFYMRWTETDRFGNERTSHLLVGPNSTTPAPADGQPSWAATYWFWKSASVAPGVPDMKFDLETRQQMKTATGTVRDDGEGMHNTVAKGAPELNDANQAQKVTTTTITLKGQLIVESVNRAVVPGVTFGWAPSPMGVLAFVDGKKRLVLIDRAGHKREVPGATGVLLPAWSPDGTRIAYLQKKSKKTYVLNIIEVGR